MLGENVTYTNKRTRLFCYFLLLAGALVLAARLFNYGPVPSDAETELESVVMLISMFIVSLGVITGSLLLGKRLSGSKFDNR